MATISLEQIENAFLPAKEIFRSNQIRWAQSPGRAGIPGPACAGRERSDSWQQRRRQVIPRPSAYPLRNGATPDSLAATQYRFRSQAGFFLALQYTCGNSITSTAHLLERLLTSSECLAPWVYDIPAAKKILESYTPKFEAGIFGVNLGMSGVKSTETTTHRAGPAPDTISVFTNVIAILLLRRSLRPTGSLSLSTSSIRSSTSPALHRF